LKDDQEFGIGAQFVVTRIALVKTKLQHIVVTTVEPYNYGQVTPERDTYLTSAILEVKILSPVFSRNR
jgi:hypothetical protein